MRSLLLLVLLLLLVACRATPPAGSPTPSTSASASAAPASPSRAPQSFPADRACDGAQTYAPLPAPIPSPILKCTQRDQKGSDGGIHRFYTTVDGRTMYAFEALVAPDPKSRNATERTDGTFELGGQTFSYRLLEPTPGQKQQFTPELYVAGSVRGVHVELVLQVSSPDQKERVLGELKALLQAALDAR